LLVWVVGVVWSLLAVGRLLGWKLRLLIGVVASGVLARLPVISLMALRIAGVIGTELTTLLAMLEATRLRGAVTILASWWAKAAVVLVVGS